MLLDILLIVISISVVVTCFFLIKAIRQITGSIGNIEKNIQELSEKALPILDNLETASNSMMNILADVEKQYDEISDGINNIKRRINNFVSDIKYNFNPENAGSSILNTFSAIRKGIVAFWYKLRN